MAKKDGELYKCGKIPTEEQGIVYTYTYTGGGGKSSSSQNPEQVSESRSS